MIPKIKLPYYPVTIPDNNKTIHIKPYTIEIEKYLVQLDNKQNLSVQMNALGEILKYCIVEDIDIDSLSVGTVIWLYLKCYEISVKDCIEFDYNHQCDDKKTNNITMTIKISDIKYDCDNDPLLITIDTEDGKYYLEFNALKLRGIKDIDDNDNMKVICSCLERMYDVSGNNEIELTEEDKVTIINSLSLSDIEKVGEKIQNIHKPYYIIDCECSECGKKIKERIEDFFI